jgi:hypothetical protein
MRIRRTLGLLGAGAALAALPTSAMAVGGPTHPTHPTHPAHPAHPAQPAAPQPGPTATLPAKAKAYGRFCQGESKTHVAGTPGTPFSTCVTDMAKVATGKASNPHRVCLNESKRHVAGTKQTPYSQCVSGAERLLKTQGKETGHASEVVASTASRHS